MKILVSLIFLIIMSSVYAGGINGEAIKSDMSITESNLRFEPLEELDFLLQDRSPPKCNWADCVDSCEESRRKCLKKSDSSNCGPRFDRCKASCNKRCK